MKDLYAQGEALLSEISAFSVLGVRSSVTKDELRKRYNELAVKFHPDKNAATNANDVFIVIQDAYKALLAYCDERDERVAAHQDSMTESNISYTTKPTGPLYESTSDLRQRKGQQETNTRSRAYNRRGPNDEDSVEESDAEEEYVDGEDDGDGQPRRRPYEMANQRVPQEYRSQKLDQILLNVTIMGICVATLCSFLFFVFCYQSVYKLQPMGDYKIERRTPLGLVYYVKKDFDKDHKQFVQDIDKEIESNFLTNLASTCNAEMRYHEIDDLIEKLKATSVSPSTPADNTATLLCEISATKDPKLFDKHELAEVFLHLAKSPDRSIRKEAAKCIAEITKSEVQRKKFTQKEIIESFIDCLRELPAAESMELPIQICRALGNICYLNDEARDIILELKADEVLVQLLDITDIGDTENALQFIKVRGGLLSNYLLGGEGLAKRAMELNIMDKLQRIITLGMSNVEEHEDLLLNTLPLLSILTENVADLSFDSNLNIQLSRILAASTNPDLAEMCLELLHYQAESDEVKLLLAKDGLCETIYQLLEKYKTLASTNEARALMKLACELIVLILTGDESMHFLYSTSLLKNMEDWLDSEDIDLLTTGVLALGNFARTDSHCIYMVENRVMNRLLEVLAKNNGVKDDVRLQHALLSALRNLVIPKPNKGAVIQAGLVETILPMLEIHQPPVVFKLLGTLRMTVDGQESLALELLKNKTLIEQLVHWSKSSDYAGVTGESLRLMAWLIKHAYLNKIAYALPRKGDAPVEQFADKLKEQQNFDRSSLSSFIGNEGTVEAMVNMLTSQHLVMQNEALIALCILSVVYLANSNASPEEAEDAAKLLEALIKYEVGKKLAELIKKSSDTMTKEIVENLQNCTNLLKSSDKLVGHLEENNINELLKSIPILTEYCTL